jgi:hypothetical protein
MMLDREAGTSMQAIFTKLLPCRYNQEKISIKADSLYL